MPNIDFEKFTLLIANDGRKPSGGYSVYIASIRDTGDRLVVSVNVEVPDRCTAIAQIADPIALVEIPKKKPKSQ